MKMSKTSLATLASISTIIHPSHRATCQAMEIRPSHRLPHIPSNLSSRNSMNPSTDPSSASNFINEAYR